MLQNFRTYQLAVQLYRDCEIIPAKHYLKDQLLRAASSIALNLSEGSAKPSKKERTRFYTIAFASLREVQALIDHIPGAEAAIKISGSGGGLASMLGGGVMALGAKLMGFGLGMSDIQTVARELFRFGRDKIGADGMNVIVAETPGLSQFA